MLTRPLLFLTVLITWTVAQGQTTPTIQSIDSGQAICVRDDGRVKYSTTLTCDKQVAGDSVTYSYKFTDAHFSRWPGDTITIPMDPIIIRYHKPDSSLYWQNTRLCEYEKGAIDTVANIQCCRFLYDLPTAADEELTFYFSPDYGLLYMFSNAWGNSVTFLYQSGQLKDILFNFIIEDGAMKKSKNPR